MNLPIYCNRDHTMGDLSRKAGYWHKWWAEISHMNLIATESPLTYLGTQ